MASLMLEEDGVDWTHFSIVLSKWLVVFDLGVTSFPLRLKPQTDDEGVEDALRDREVEIIASFNGVVERRG